VLVLLSGWAFLAGGFSRPLHVSRVVQITHSGRVALGDGIAADSSRIYFTQRSGGNFSLVQAPVQGGAAQPLPMVPSLHSPEVLDISPDHSQLLMAARSGTQDDRPLYLVSTAGGPVRSLAGLSGSSAAWSRDGRAIVFSHGSSVFRVNPDGTGCRKLLSTPDRADGVRWSPGPGTNMLRFALSRNDLRPRMLWEAHADGTNLHLLAISGWNTNLQWSDTDDNGIWVASGEYYVFRSRRGQVTSIWAILDRVRVRDRRDREREVSPLVRATDAVLVDNTAMGIEETARLIVMLAHEREKELTAAARK